MVSSDFSKRIAALQEMIDSSSHIVFF
jgi:hypothetical protein